MSKNIEINYQNVANKLAIALAQEQLKTAAYEDAISQLQSESEPEDADLVVDDSNE